MLTSSSPLSFLGLLVSLILLLFMPGLFSDYSGALISILFALVLIASLYLVATERKHLIIGLTLAVPALLTHWSLPLLSETTRLTINACFQILFLSYVCTQIFTYLFRARKIESNVIYAALCLYLMLGLIWTFAYLLIEINSPGAIALKNEFDLLTDNPRELIAEIMYFSFVTITTLGYGDITPVSPLAQSLVIIQAFVGQIYVAIVIARLVGLQIAAQLHDNQE